MVPYGLEPPAQTALRELCEVAAVGSPPMHLRAPSVDRGVHAFGWSVVFFLYMWLGALAIGLPNGASFIVSLVLAGAIFLFVRTRGGDRRGRQ